MGCGGGGNGGVRGGEVRGGGGEVKGALHWVEKH